MALLLAFALMFNNGTTVALAMCQHETVQAHADARSSADAKIAAGAAAEEAAERSISHSKAVSDGSPASVVAFVMASDVPALGPPQARSVGVEPFDEPVPEGSTVPPLLRPPLA